MVVAMPKERDRIQERYRLERRLGSGGMATVWLARDEELGRPVALKLLSELLADDPRYAARFQREARIAAAVSHPNLVDVFDFDFVGGRPYLVMEYIEGGDLTQVISEDQRSLDPRQVARNLLSALASIHEAGIVHRDVKPDNVLVDADDRVKLTDFGIARSDGGASLTDTGEVLGTLRYMAPELREGEAATPRSDLYGIGILFAECFPAAPADVTELAYALSQPDPLERPASAEAALTWLDESGAPHTRPVDAEPTLRMDVAAPAPDPTPIQGIAQTDTTVRPAGVSSRRRYVHVSIARAAAVLLVVAVVIAALVLASGGSERGRPPLASPPPAAAAQDGPDQRPRSGRAAADRGGPVLALGGGTREASGPAEEISRR